MHKSLRKLSALLALTMLSVALGAWLCALRVNPQPKQTPQPDAASVPLVKVASPASQTPAAKPVAEKYYPILETPDGFAPRIELPKVDPLSRWKSPAKIVSPHFPRNFSGEVRVASGIADVSSVPANARANSTGTLAEDGSLIYKDAFEGCDVSYRCEAYKTEEFIIVKNANAPTRWTWELDTHGLTPRLTPANTIELCDTDGIPRLRINAPDGKDANGKALRVGERLALKLDGKQVTLAASIEDCAFPVVIDPTWSSTGSMAVARINHSSILLNSGSVLTVGGFDGTSILASCELYDPNTGVWSSTGSLNNGRDVFTATSLTNGQVLVAGGEGPPGPNALTSCEIYNPSTSTWLPTGSLNSARYYHSANLLNNGKVLVTGGSLNSNVLQSTEIYDPIGGTWTTTGTLITPRYVHRSVLLSSGKVLVTGGFNTSYLNSCETYDVTLGTWSATGSMAVPRFDHTALVLPSGQVLVAGGFNGSWTSTCELYSPGTGLWGSTGNMLAAREGHTTTLLSSGLILASAGLSPPVLSACELYDASGGSWSSTNNLNVARFYHTATLLPDGNVLVCGGRDNTVSYFSSCEIFSIKLNALPISRAVHSSSSVSIQLKSDSVSPPVSFVIVSQPSHGILSGVPPNITYTASPTFSGIDTFSYTASDSTGTSTPAVVTVSVTNAAPTVIASVSPTFTVEGQTVSITSVASDPDGDLLTYLWDFGDGTVSTEANPVHIFATGGTYSVTVTVSDSAGATASATIAVQVYLNSDRPTARFTSSDLNGFVGQPLGFDATFSSDPLNDIVSYDWDFGDGSPHGKGQLISRVYAAEGTYTVTLTVTDGRGLSDTTTLTMVVLPVAQAGLLNSNIKYSVSWNRGATNADSLALSATVNVGTTSVNTASPLSLRVVGQTFTGTSATKLSMPLAAKSGAQVKWQIKANTKKGAPKGTYDLKCTIKHASLGQAFALAGVTGTKSSTAKIPLRLGIGGSSFESSISSQFRFGSGGAKASGGGQGPK